MEENGKKILVGHFVVGEVQTNCYFMYREGSDETIVVDPGDKGREIGQTLTYRGLKVKLILLTHAHFDHILGVRELKEYSGAPVYAARKEEPICTDSSKNGSAMYLQHCIVRPDRYLDDGEEFTAAGITLRMIETPGHTAGSCCYYNEEQHILFSGDTLFRESFGRTDFPTGSFQQIMDSIKNKLYLLPDDTEVLPGHMGPTTIEHEKKYNYWVR